MKSLYELLKEFMDAIRSVEKSFEEVVLYDLLGDEGSNEVLISICDKDVELDFESFLKTLPSLTLFKNGVFKNISFSKHQRVDPEVLVNGEVLEDGLFYSFDILIEVDTAILYHGHDDIAELSRYIDGNRDEYPFWMPY